VQPLLAAGGNVPSSPEEICAALVAGIPAQELCQGFAPACARGLCGWVE